jgi:flotillin
MSIMLIGSIAGGVVFTLFVLMLFMLRRVVPTNMVHIVQSSKKTTPYGRGKEAGNTYYEWPAWIPYFGVTVTQFPESNFQVSLDNYDAYDTNRLPFVVDVTAFFRVDNAETAAQRISSFNELKLQLISVLQGSVRRILATNQLEDIMQERSSLGQQFTAEVKDQIKEWGVVPVKTIEFMDLRDSPKAQVIANIMAKEQSRIDKESRVAVAANQQEAKLKEIDAQRTVEVQRQDAEQQVGLRTAEKDKAVGIAQQQANQEVLTQKKETTTREMDIAKVTAVRQADIDKDVAVVAAEQQKRQREIAAEADKNVRVTTAEGEKTAMVTKAEGSLEAAKLNAQGIEAEGKAKGAAEQAILMAPVQTQITLAQEIGTNEGYQRYLIQIRQVEASEHVGIEMAQAMKNADLKIIANSGDVQSGITKLTDVFTPTGGTSLGGMLEALSQTAAGKAVLDKFTKPA